VNRVRAAGLSPPLFRNRRVRSTGLMVSIRYPQDFLCTQASTCTPTIAQGSLACSPTVPADRSRWNALGPCPTAG
jgi:hypothetical protein